MTGDSSLFEAMPRHAPLEMKAQSLRQEPDKQVADLPNKDSSRLWRSAVFVPAIIGTGALLYALHGWLSNGGMTGLEWSLLALIGMTFVWATLSVSTVGVAVAGLLARQAQGAYNPESIRPMDVALLVPIYHEDVRSVFGNAAAMIDDLSRRNSRHRYSLFILSDSRDANFAVREEHAFQALRENASPDTDVHYRRRLLNKDQKVGNILDWVTRWGAGHEAMIVLDADSLMTGRAIDSLSDELSRDASAGLIQSCPMLVDANTLFARAQQFSNMAYGWLLAEGLANWTRGEANYWGHNAIIRTRAFAASAGLPRLKGRGGRDHMILSHDFVEAGLLRRAGWRVRFLPRLSGSYEETPHTLIDYVKRDERWCRGNLQHLRLLATRGMHPVSRYHLLHGAVCYLLSPAWFFLLMIWFLLGKGSDTNVVRYFSEANPLFPDWPPAMSHIDSAIFLTIMYAMLLTPKITGAAIICLHSKATRLYGGRLSFLGAFAVELILSIAYAPVLMVQQTKAVVRATIGTPVAWTQQNRLGAGFSLSVLMRFHWLETLLGFVLIGGLISGLVSLWLLPIAGSLAMAVPLSWLSWQPVNSCLPHGLRMNNYYSLREPGILRQAKAARAALDSAIGGPNKIPAE